MARTKRKSIHYVNNAEFSSAVVEYVTVVQKAKSEETILPVVPDYIAQCFLKIAEGLSQQVKLYSLYISRRNGNGCS